MSNLRLAVVALLALVVLACGGAGGGGATVPLGALAYETDWRLRQSPGGGFSQRLTLMTQLGVVVRSVIIESGASDIETTRLADLPAGQYWLRAELFSQATLGGVKTGQVELPVTINGETRQPVVVGGSPTTVQVVPDSIEVVVPRSHRFFAYARTASGTPTFSPVGAFTWSTLGSIGTTDGEGVFQAQTAGQGAVRAFHAPTGFLSAATVTTQPPATTTAKWTVLVYMNASSDLYPFSDLNMNQMERVAGNPDVRFVVQWKQSRTTYPSSSFDGTRRYLARPDQGSAVASDIIQELGTGVDMGKWESLRDFVAWGKTYFPAQRTVLILWGHGNGWRRKPNEPLSRAVCYDDETGNAIQIWDLKKALASQNVDILAWDASLMQMIEVAFEVRSVCGFVVGSEESPPAEGYPYDALFSRFRDQPDATTRDLSKAFVDAMLGAPGYVNRKITQSVLESARLDALERAVDSLAGELITHGSALRDVIPAVRNASQSYSPQSSPPRFYRDLYDVCQRLEAATDILSVKSAAANVRQRLVESVVWEGHNANSPGSRGVSIDFTPGSLFLNSANDYQSLEFGQRNRWDDWLVTSP